MSDLISREELTKKLEYLCDCLCDYSKRQREFMCDACKLGAVIDALEEMLSVEPERKTGKWIVEEDCEGKTRTCTCNLCGYETGEYTWVNPNYCENCGAKMEVDG